MGEPGEAVQTSAAASASVCLRQPALELLVVACALLYYVIGVGIGHADDQTGSRMRTYFCFALFVIAGSGSWRNKTQRALLNP
mmetsp:Transcript_2346/g.5415  ORF Transcript_2346/g.5415 Transcript_2346/m.5415 type:complete len:83 (+) Transcript_2346:504-752(+)